MRKQDKLFYYKPSALKMIMTFEDCNNRNKIINHREQEKSIEWILSKDDKLGQFHVFKKVIWGTIA